MTAPDPAYYDLLVVPGGEIYRRFQRVEGERDEGAYRGALDFAGYRLADIRAAISEWEASLPYQHRRFVVLRTLFQQGYSAALWRLEAAASGEVTPWQWLSRIYDRLGNPRITREQPPPATSDPFPALPPESLHSFTPKTGVEVLGILFPEVPSAGGFRWP